MKKLLILFLTALPLLGQTVEQSVELLRQLAVANYTPAVKARYQQLLPTAKKALAVPANAAAELGMIYRYGALGVAENDEEAFKWFSLAAKGGNLAALYEGGMMALTGKGTAADVLLGESWLESAADKGHPRAQYTLGCLYSGLVNDVKWTANLTVSTKWYIAAKANGDFRADSWLKDNYKKMGPDQIAEAQAAALPFVAKNKGALQAVQEKSIWLELIVSEAELAAKKPIKAQPARVLK